MKYHEENFSYSGHWITILIYDDYPAHNGLTPSFYALIDDEPEPTSGYGQSSLASALADAKERIELGIYDLDYINVEAIQEKIDRLAGLYRANEYERARETAS